MSHKNGKFSITRRNDRRRENQGPIRVDHSIDSQSSTRNKSKRSRSDKSNEVFPSSPVPRSRSSVTRQEVSTMTIFSSPVNRQATKNLSPSASLRQNSQLGNEYYSSFESINVPLASSEDISIENSIRDLDKRSSRTSTSRNLPQHDSDKLSKNCRSHSYQKIKIEDPSSKKSFTESTSQLHQSRDASIPRSRIQSDYRLSTSMDWKMGSEENKASIRDIPRLSPSQIKTTRFQARDDGRHTASQKRIRTESVPERVDLTAMPTRFSDTLQSSKSSSQKISLRKTDTSGGLPLSKTFVQRGRCGLRNIGNTCFMNSALQCLSNVPDLTEYILERGVTNILNTTNDLGTHGKLALAYAELIKVIWSGKQTTADGSAIKRYVSELSPRFMGYNQQDSHEFLNELLGALHEDLKQYSENTENETSLIAEIFHGQIRSTVTCICGEPLTTFDSISFLALPIPDLPPVPPRRKYSGEPPKRPVTLTDCFKELFKVEMIGENGQWFCNTCNCLMDAEKKLDLWAPPKVLILQLKRFNYDTLNNSKIQTLVEFPFDSPLDLCQFVTDPDYANTTLYDLVAISSHTGSLAGGHYTAYAKNFLTKSWLHFNDENVCEADEKSLQSPHAYILVYRRQE